MAAKNSLKIYLPDSYYHIYNRGVEKRLIFQDEQDYAVSLSYLKTYLLPKNEQSLMKILINPNSDSREKAQALNLLRMNNFSDEIKLLAHALMPNHFHLLVKQKSPNSIDKFMNSFSVRQTMYFNKKNKRVGPLFQGVYKAVQVKTEEQLLYLTSYIHRNPLKSGYVLKSASKDEVLKRYTGQPSSYLEYLGLRKTDWIHPEEILSFFSKKNPNLSYRTFVEQNDDVSPISDLVLDL